MKKLSDKYEVLIPETSSTKIRVSNMHEAYENDKLIEAIRSQNDNVKNGIFSVIKTFKNTRRNVFEAILEIDDISFHEIMKDEKLRIGRNVCKVKEHDNVTRCFKCCGYNHLASKGKNTRACLKCGEDHLKYCSAENNVCVNCKNIVKKYQRGVVNVQYIYEN